MRAIPRPALGGIFRGAVPMRRRPRDETGDRRARRARGARRRVARARASCRARGAGRGVPELADRLAEQQRAVALARSAAAEVEAPAALRARVEAQRSARRAPRDAAPLVLIGAARAVVAAVGIGLACSVRAPSASASTPPSRRPSSCRAPAARRRSPRRLGLADRARRHGAAAPRGRALLRGVAAQRRRRARADRDVQRGPEGHALGRRVAEGLSRR